MGENVCMNFTSTAGSGRIEVNSITQGLPDSGVFLGIPLSRWNFHAQIVHAAGLEKGGSVLNYKQKTVARKIT